MKYLFAVACLIATSAFAQEEPQHIRDMSMTPDETMQDIARGQPQGPLVSPGEGFDEAMPPIQQQPLEPPFDERALPVEPPHSAAFSGFMDGYCDPGFRPRLSGAGNMASAEACIDQHKKQACGDFSKLPAEVRAALDDSIGCLYTVSNNDVASNPGDPGCADNDSHRMKLVEKYWSDAATTHALVFLPDEVLNAPGACMRGGK